MSKSSGLLRIGKYRLIYGYIMCVVALVFARHDILIPGLGIALVGIALRIWSAGYIEKNSRLATGGPYGLCRNPLYLGSFTFGAGSVIAIQEWWLAAVYVAGFALFYVPTILSEQKFLREKFQGEYADYCRKVPIFLPWKYSRGTGQFSFKMAVHNREHLHTVAHVGFLLALVLAVHLRSV